MNQIFADMIGCFKDSSRRVLEGGRTWNNHMTVNQCRRRCEKENSRFYGLEVKEKSWFLTIQSCKEKKRRENIVFVCMFFLLAGNECFCGNFLPYNLIKKLKKKNSGIIVFVFIFYRLGMNAFVGIV